MESGIRPHGQIKSPGRFIPGLKKNPGQTVAGSTREVYAVI
jgi:hypothetical protein